MNPKTVSHVVVELKSVFNSKTYIARYDDNSAIICLNGDMILIESYVEYNVKRSHPAPVIPIHSG